MSAQSISNAVAMIQELDMPERLDSSTAPTIEQSILASIHEGVVEITLDFHKVRFLTAAGLRMILAAMRAMKTAEGKLSVRHLHGQARAMFEACGFDNLIPVQDDHGITSIAARVA